MVSLMHLYRTADMNPTSSLPQVAASESKTVVRDRLVTENMSIVRPIALRVKESLPVHVDIDDLIHAGIMGLLDAAEKFDDSRQVTFRLYARHRIRGAMLDSLRDQDWATRDLRRWHKRLESATAGG